MVKKYNKMVICLLLIMVGIMNAKVHAYANEDNGFQYSFINNNTEIEITGYNALSANVVIPSEIRNVKVTSIGKNAFVWCRNIVSIKIPDTVTNIGDNAFKNCISLKSLNIPVSVTSIGKYAFNNCSISSITIPDGITTIEMGTFSSCANLTSVVIPDSVTDIEESAFSSCEKLSSVTMSKGIKSIGKSAFERCTALKRIELPKSLTQIDNTAFEKKVGFVVEEGSYADTWALTNGFIVVSHPKAVGTLMTISNYKAKVKVTSSESYNPTVEYLSPTSRQVTSVSIPESVIVDEIEYTITSIDDNAFGDCQKLRKVSIPASVTKVGIRLFRYCTKLKTIRVSPLNKVYDSRYECNAIIETESNTLIAGCVGTIIPNTVKYIGDYAFQSCTKLTNMVIPSGVKRIGKYAFNNCSIKNIEIPKSVSRIGSGAFGKNVIIKADKRSYARKWARRNRYMIFRPVGTTYKFYNSDNKYKVTSDITNDSTVEFVGTDKKKIKEVVVPDSIKIDNAQYKVTSIANKALKGKKTLKRVTIGNNIDSIGNNAFAKCKNLKKITIKSTSITVIGKNAIKGINKTAVVNVPKTNKKTYKKLFNKKTGYKKTMKIK
ncbi:MAG: leucine-rich repeat domain-containing protein [Lachnospiraceae bacterium]|nr:leucine-rich repeat domain-containing protein [Lachnospiraceae bacterium]